MHFQREPSNTKIGEIHRYICTQVPPTPVRKYIRPSWVSCLLCPCLKYIKALPQAAAAARRRCALSSYGRPYTALEAVRLCSLTSCTSLDEGEDHAAYEVVRDERLAL